MGFLGYAPTGSNHSGAERLKQANCPLVAQQSRAAYPLNGLKSVSMTSHRQNRKQQWTNQN